MIYKGCQKKMILLRDPSGSFFEEAYFILRDDLPPHTAETDMVREANRIIHEATGHHDGMSRTKSRRTSLTNVLWMLFGFASGAAATFVFYSIL